ncbi:hydrogen cyanide synthase subunit HcnB [mine drainage metagenome]|uniref:Hydrogen cyanide synthase subunit HcnB n=1 Tax=mine drainage metagenome TaxID=410659 RepID=A0A1J5QK43_9ZZZZ
MAGIYAAGECTGSRGAELAAVEGAIAGLAFVGRFDPGGAEARARRRWREFAARVERCFAIDRAAALAAARDAVVCRCEDVAFGAVAACSGWDEAKLLTRCGMGPCQGRVCGSATRALLGWGPTRVRGPLTPTSLGALAGERGARGG